MTDITNRRKILDFYRSNYRMPSYAEIMDITGLRSKDSVFKLVGRLSRDGYLRKDRRGRILPTSVLGEIKILGLVEAGIPSVAEEESIDTIALDEYLIKDRDSSYLLRVKGDSMKDAGIIEGDLVIAERADSAKEGEIVIAEVDGGWTMKYLRMKKGQPYLEPANDAFEPIYPTDSFAISAVVRGVVRKYT